MRIDLTTSAIEAATAVAGLSRRALEITIASLMHAAPIDPDHSLGALSTVCDLDRYGVYDGKIAELFDDVCCGCHVNLKLRLRARSLGLVGEEGFWAPDLCIQHYLAEVRKTLPRFAKGRAVIAARQKAPAPPTKEDAEQSIKILGAMSTILATMPPHGTAQRDTSDQRIEPAESTLLPVMPAAGPRQRDTSDPHIEPATDYTGGFPGE